MGDIKFFGVDFEETKLANELKLYSFYKPNSPIYFRVFFYAGSQFDEDKPGLAHFCEHMMVSGTEKYPTKVILNEKIQELGARSNAFTYKQNLWLTIDLADRADLLEMFERVDQIMNYSIFSPDIIEKERGAILAEQTRNISNPSQHINVLQCSLLFQGTNLENPVLGFDETVKNISREDLINYRDKYLTNGQLAYFISGDFDEQVVIDSLNKINNKRRPIEISNIKLPIITDKKTLFKYISNPEQNYISLSTRINPIINKLDRVSGDLFSTILGQGNTSRLHKVLRNNKGLIYGISSNLSSNSEYASLSINTSCKVKDTAEVIRTIKEELSKLVENRVNSEELERAKKNTIRNMKFASETAGFFVELQIMRELTSQPDPILPGEYVELIKLVAVEDVNHFIKEYLAGVELLLAGIGDFSIYNK